MTTRPPADHARVAYDTFAALYDVFTAHHRYDEWTQALEGLARRHGLQGKRLLDVACGTGKSFLPFLDRGFEVCACDVSEEMVRRARAKCPPTVRLAVHDMRTLPRLGTFDLVCCLDDAMNYLMSPDEVTSALRAMSRNLAPTGVLVFDVNSVRAYREFFAELSVVQSEEAVIVLDGHASAGFEVGGTARATAELLACGRDGKWRREQVVHHQRHHPRPSLEAALAQAGLVAVGVYGMQFDGTVEDDFDEMRNSKAIYVARRSDAP